MVDLLCVGEEVALVAAAVEVAVRLAEVRLREHARQRPVAQLGRRRRGHLRERVGKGARLFNGTFGARPTEP